VKDFKIKIAKVKFLYHKNKLAKKLSSSFYDIKKRVFLHLFVATANNGGG